MTLDEARNILEASLDSRGNIDTISLPCTPARLDYASWRIGETDICLDGDFTPIQLEAIIVWMRAHP